MDATSCACPCTDHSIDVRIEALLLASDRPMSDIRIAEVLGLVEAPSAQLRAALAAAGQGDAAAAESAVTESSARKGGAKSAGPRADATKQVRDAIDRLNADYEAAGRGFRIESVAGGRQIMTIAALAPIIARLRGEREQARLTQAALETLAIIAYRQPILRADIESIRGVACGEVLRSLMERRLVRITGRAEEVGRPMLYGTTQEFLRTFGISSVTDLPQQQDLRG